MILPRSEADGIAIETVNVSRARQSKCCACRTASCRNTRSITGESNEEGGWGYWGFNSAGEDVGVAGL